MYWPTEKKESPKIPSVPGNPAVPPLMGPVAFRPHLAIGLAFLYFLYFDSKRSLFGPVSSHMSQVSGAGHGHETLQLPGDASWMTSAELRLNPIQQPADIAHSEFRSASGPFCRKSPLAAHDFSPNMALMVGTQNCR